MIISSTHGVGNWIFIYKQMELDPYFILHTKINKKWIKDLIVRLKTKIYRRKHQGKSSWLWSWQWFYGCDIRSTGNKNKNNQVELHQTFKKAAALKGHNQHRKGNLWNIRKYLQIIYLIKGQYPKYIRRFCSSETNNSIKKWANHRATKAVHHNYWTRGPEPKSCNHWSLHTL